MRAWKQKLPESQQNVLQEIVDQIPTAMGVREVIEAILDNLAGGSRKSTVSPSVAYGIYLNALAQHGASADEFDDLDSSTQHAWAMVAEKMSPPEFRYVICRNGDVTGTNDETVARRIADMDHSYVIDMLTFMWVVNDNSGDDNSIVEE